MPLQMPAPLHSSPPHAARIAAPALPARDLPAATPTIVHRIPGRYPAHTTRLTEASGPGAAATMTIATVTTFRLVTR